jgi:hypothetical protein
MLAPVLASAIFRPYSSLETMMSDETNSQDWGDDMNRPEHESTYESFLSYTKWGCIGVALILVFLLVFVYD